MFLLETRLHCWFLWSHIILFFYGCMGHINLVSWQFLSEHTDLINFGDWQLLSFMDTWLSFMWSFFLYLDCSFAGLGIDCISIFGFTGCINLVSRHFVRKHFLCHWSHINLTVLVIFLWHYLFHWYLILYWQCWSNLLHIHCWIASPHITFISLAVLVSSISCTYCSRLFIWTNINKLFLARLSISGTHNRSFFLIAWFQLGLPN